MIFSQMSSRGCYPLLELQEASPLPHPGLSFQPTSLQRPWPRQVRVGGGFCTMLQQATAVGL